MVLKSSLETLKKTKYIYTEVNLIEQYKNILLWNDFKKFLNENNFEVIHEGLYWADGGNVLLRNKTFF